MKCWFCGSCLENNITGYSCFICPGTPNYMIWGVKDDVGDLLYVSFFHSPYRITLWMGEGITVLKRGRKEILRLNRLIAVTPFDVMDWVNRLESLVAFS